MSTLNLNLARKWRSKNFDQIVGQELPIRILKNSLYLNQFFPVYLFAGQRGCGKTTTARVFAAAVNCQLLPDFQKNPKQSSIPCLTCASCSAMQAGNHPDFIEIDAASHTGVDNVRQIIDAASLLPVMGRKKIYLIDEAHMLSKAAFNAFLKILEEPPMGVLFILATTDTQKIIETVRSRSFQLFFKAIEEQQLVQHLANVCAKENIRFEKEGLHVIIHEAEGSARDALNILEQVRFAASAVTAVTVRQALGHIDDEPLLTLMHLMVQGDQQALITFLDQQRINTYAPAFIWKRLVEIFRIALWAKHGARQQDAVVQQVLFKKIVKEVVWTQLYEALEFLYKNELLFFKTSAQQSFLEMIFLQLCYQNKRNDNSGTAPLGQQPEILSQATDEYEQEDEDEQDDPEDPVDDQDAVPRASAWQQFVTGVAKLHDPLLDSLFSQAHIIEGANPAILEVSFSQELVLFQDWLEDSKSKWLPVLQFFMPEVQQLKPLFNRPAAARTVTPTVRSVAQSTVSKADGPKVASAQAPQTKNFYSSRPAAKKASLVIGEAIDISDVTVWKKTNLILRHFPGKVTQLKENV